MLGGGAPTSTGAPGDVAGAAAAASGAEGTLVAMGPGPTNGIHEVDLDTAEPGDLAPASPASPGGSSLLASARELLDAAEAWRGRPVVPV